MAAPFVVLVLVAAGAATLGETSSMTAAAQRALGPDAVMLIEQPPSLPSEDEAAALADRVRAEAIVEVDWAGPLHTHVVLHIRPAQQLAWVERAIDFAPTDPRDEYGRTIGFAIASMIASATGKPGSQPSQGALERSGSATPAVSANGSMPVSEAPPSGPRGGSSTPPPPAPTAAASDPGATVSPAQPERPPPAGIKRWSLQVAGVLGGPPAAAGGIATADASLLPTLGADVTTGVRLGTLPEAQATFSAFQVGAGFRWTFLASRSARPVEGDLRASLLATDLTVTRESASRSRWAPEARVEADFTWFVVTPNLGFSFGAGVEATLGNTRIAVGNDIVATIPPLRAIATLGPRGRF
jgi:hypothetical protein